MDEADVVWDGSDWICVMVVSEGQHSHGLVCYPIANLTLVVTLVVTLIPTGHPLHHLWPCIAPNGEVDDESTGQRDPGHRHPCVADHKLPLEAAGRRHHKTICKR